MAGQYENMNTMEAGWTVVETLPIGTGLEILLERRSEWFIEMIVLRTHLMATQGVHQSGARHPPKPVCRSMLGFVLSSFKPREF